MSGRTGKLPGSYVMERVLWPNDWLLGRCLVRTTECVTSSWIPIKAANIAASWVTSRQTALVEGLLRTPRGVSAAQHVKASTPLVSSSGRHAQAVPGGSSAASPSSQTF